MKFVLDEYVNLNFLIYRWDVRYKFIGLILLMFVFVIVKSWYLIVLMLFLIIMFYGILKLFLLFLVNWLCYLGFFLLGVIFLLFFIFGKIIVL